MGKDDRAEIVETARKQIKEDALGDPVGRERFQGYLKIAAPILSELAGLGYDIDTLDDLRHQGKPWKSALPTLLRWLPKIDDPCVKDSIVRCLSVPWVGNNATAQLIEEFRRYAPILPSPPTVWVDNKMRELSDEEIKAVPFFHLAWAIGNALSIVGVSGFEGQIIELCRNTKYGMARQMLVLSLGRLGVSEAEETAVQLLRDEGVQLHAIGALGRMKSKRALFELERLVADKRPAVRKEARKAITKIMR
jgi:hypothetical protein